METKQSSSLGMPEKLSKANMKKIIGGMLVGGGSTVGVGPHEGCFKCCRDDAPLTCSACVYSYETAPCATGSSLQSCGPCRK